MPLHLHCLLLVLSLLLFMLPVKCLVGRGATSSQTASAPADAYSRKDGCELSSTQPRSHKPSHASGDDFVDRFTRNANIVASGVARNILGVGNYIKQSLHDILYPDRRRPK